MTSTPFSLTICGAHELPELARKPVTHLISIWHTNADSGNYTRGINALFPNTNVLFVVFDDIEEVYHENECPPDTTHLTEVLNFSSTFDNNSVVGIHCMAGISRSTAVAIAVLSQHLGRHCVMQAAIIVQCLRPQARPNRLVITLADEHLQFDGQLIEAVETTFGDSPPESFKGWTQGPSIH